MLGLPESTELKKQFSKAGIYKKFGLTSSAQAKFDSDISRMEIAAEISSEAIPSLTFRDVKRIFVVRVALKADRFDPKNIEYIAKTIDQKIVFVLEHGETARLAVWRGVLHVTNEAPLDELSLPMIGLTVDDIWQNIVIHIGDITIAEGSTLDRQIADDVRAKKIEVKIEALDRRIRAERQTRRQQEMLAEMTTLKRELKTIRNGGDADDSR